MPALAPLNTVPLSLARGVAQWLAGWWRTIHLGGVLFALALSPSTWRSEGRAVIARHVVETGQAGLGSPGVDELRWLKPVYPGDTLHVHATIVEARPSRSKPEIGSFRSATTVTNQDGEKVMTFTSIVLMRRRPAAT